MTKSYQKKDNTHVIHAIQYMRIEALEIQIPSVLEATSFQLQLLISGAIRLTRVFHVKVFVQYKHSGVISSLAP